MNDTFEEERKVWEEVKESMSKRIMDLSEKVSNQAVQIQNYIKDAMAANANYELLQNRLKELQSSLEAEKRTNEGQIAQILRLNEEVILSVDEKTKLQEQISELEQEIHRLEDGMKDPKNYYREEMQKVTDPSPSKSQVIEDKVSLEEMHRLKCEELTGLKQVLSEKLQGRIEQYS